MSESTVLVVGGGGREHALAWKLAQSPKVDRVLVAPGNAGTLVEPGVENVDVAAEDVDSLLALAQARQVTLTVVGPEAPLAAGIVDRFVAAGLKCFGPDRAAAEVEASKAFTKDFMQRHAIPTAAYAAFEDVDAAEAYIRAQGAPLVVKADGLAAGKGVVLAETVDEAVDAARVMLSGEGFGEAGKRIVVEEFLVGEEASFIAIVDGETIQPLATSQDHKAALDGDKGPNTGGMGAYSPAPVVTDVIHDRIMAEVMLPTVRGLAADGRRFTGFLYAGLMIDAEGNPRVLEFNVRFGDPETQPILMRLRSDLFDLINAALDGSLGNQPVEWDERPALGVVMAAGGYPGSYEKGTEIHGLDAVTGDDIKVFHAGTADKDGKVVTSGGRVLCVTALGADIATAQQAAYEGVEQIRWEGVQFRRDIGYRALLRNFSAPSSSRP